MFDLILEARWFCYVATLVCLFVCHTLILLVGFKLYVRTKDKRVGKGFLAVDVLFNNTWGTAFFADLPKRSERRREGFEAAIFESLSERVQRYQTDIEYAGTWRETVSKPIYLLIDWLDPGHFGKL